MISKVFILQLCCGSGKIKYVLQKTGALILIDAAHDKTVDATTTILSYSTTTRLRYCYSLYLILIDAAHDNAVDFGRAQPAAGRHQLLPDYIT